MSLHLTMSMLNDQSTLCGKKPGEALTQLAWAFKATPRVDCTSCLQIYESAKPAFDAFCHIGGD